jgi:hypothetical protein
MAKTALDRFVDDLLTKAEGQTDPPLLRDRYHQTAEAIMEDCLAIDPLWLADHQPELWQRMTLIDRQLERLEQRNAEQGEYDATVQKLVETVRKARTLYEQERQQSAAVQ